MNSQQVLGSASSPAIATNEINPDDQTDGIDRGDESEQQGRGEEPSHMQSRYAIYKENHT